MRSNESYESEIGHKLKEARLPNDPSLILGRIFRFGCRYGSHHQILIGTITGISISDEGGLQLEVSNQRFLGTPLVSLMRDSDRKHWMARVDCEKVEDRFHCGELTIGAL